MPERELGRADVVFAVKKDEAPFGRLKVSNGSIVWVPGGATYGYKLTWSGFDEIARKHGRHENH
jgi:hypothetical protein